MRMWMVAPVTMCRQHLYGEHVELHMFLGTLRKLKSVQGYIDNNLLEIKSMQRRHAALVYEMMRRMILAGRQSGHSSRLTNKMIEEVEPHYSHIIDFEIDRQSSAADLFGRCAECSKRRELAITFGVNSLQAFFRHNHQGDL